MDSTKKNQGSVVLVLLCAAIFAAVYIQYQLPAIAGTLMSSFSLTATQFSSIFSAPMIPTIALSIVGGVLVDRIGVKPIIIFGALVTSAGAIMRVWSTNYVMLMTCMLMAGFLPTFLNANSGKIFSQYYTMDKVGSKIGIFSAASTLAMTVGTATTAMISSLKVTFMISAVLVTVVSVALQLFWKMPRSEENSGAQSPEQLSVLECLKISVRSRHIWIIGLILGMNMAAVMVLNSFLPTALASRGMDAIDAGIYSSIIMIGNVVAAVIVPMIALKTQKTKLIISVSTIIGGLGVAFAWRFPFGAAMLVALFVTGLAMSGLIPLLMSMPVRLTDIGPMYAGTAGGIVVTLQMVCAVIIPTYIMTPLLGSNLPMFFGIGGILLGFGFVLSLFLPELDK